MVRSDERGVAIIMALFMTLLVSAVAAGMTFVARSETVSSHSYTTITQARYGAESGLAAAAHYLLSSPYAAVSPGTATDPMLNYNIVASPVTRTGGAEVVLSTQAGESNYPDANVITAFGAAATGSLAVGDATVTYGARARLIAMRQISDAMSGGLRTLQTWEITGIGRMAGSGSSEVHVTGVIDRHPVSAFRYAAFATDNGCNALSFAGGATTHSYDSRTLVAGNPVVSNSGGNVGTNGGLDANGGPTTVHGSLSTPRTGVGACTEANVTAATISGFAAVSELVTLPQPVELPSPPPINPPPPTTDVTFNINGCPANSPAQCSPTASGAMITPASPTSVVQMGNVSVSGNKVLRLHAGIYEVNSLSLIGNGTIKVESGPVIIKVAGEPNLATPIDLAGGGISNPTYDPTKLQIIYGGTGTVSITGGADTAALIYAPNASAHLSSAVAEFYGSIVTKKITATGGFSIFYDRALESSMMTAGNPVMTSFTWRSF